MRDARSHASLDDVLGDSLHASFVRLVVSVIDRKVKAIGSVDLNIKVSWTTSNEPLSATALVRELPENVSLQVDDGSRPLTPEEEGTLHRDE